VTPDLIAHADWGTNPKKCQVAVAQARSDGGYHVVSLEPPDAMALLRGDLRGGLTSGHATEGLLLAGFDFPIGLPRAYAEQVGVTFFPDFLPEIGHGQWERFADVAATAEEVGPYRPFYPARPGGTMRAHLYDGLGLVREQLRRRCDGKDAETTFWTLGGKQVGKAALAGWHYLAAAPIENVRYWPFYGPLETIFGEDPAGIVVAETYPREFYQYFRRGAEGHGSKRKQDDRLRWVPNLLDWAMKLDMTWQPDVVRRVGAGFADRASGEDEFDAVVGLLGMVAVVTGAMKSGEPTDDPAVTDVEGWILGRTANELLSSV
jgi:hypothetical protein